MNRFSTLIASLVAIFVLMVAPALAHPHVWITARAELMIGEDRAITGLRHEWTFDEAYTAYVTQGLDLNRDGKLTPEELAGLAKENTEGLQEFNYFTSLKHDGRRQSFAPPSEYGMSIRDGKVVLAFVLPLKKPATQTGLIVLEISDPTLFVYFSLQQQDSVTLAGGPTGCAITIAKAREIDPATREILQNEGVMAADKTIGLQYSNKAIIACP